MKYTVESLRQMKHKTAIVMLTAYTCPVARCLEEAQIPVILVGDTVGMVEMGFESTREVTIEHMQYHIAAVRRGAANTHIIGDLPYQCDRDPQSALLNAQRLIDAGADSVKLEGPKIDEIAYLVANGIVVVGHSGLTPQTAMNFKQVGVNSADAKRVMDESIGIEKAGAFMLVLEHIPAQLAKSITDSVTIPTIGIGAGSSCDGQVLVINDALGLGDYWPPFSKQYAQLSQTIVDAVKMFAKEVQNNEFPDNIVKLNRSSHH